VLGIVPLEVLRAYAVDVPDDVGRPSLHDLSAQGAEFLYRPPLSR